METVKCDNKREAHDVKVIYDSPDAMVAYCTICHAKETFRKDPEGRMNNQKYKKFFMRDLLQPPRPLYYKYHKGQVSTL